MQKIRYIAHGGFATNENSQHTILYCCRHNNKLGLMYDSLVHLSTFLGANTLTILDLACQKGIDGRSEVMMGIDRHPWPIFEYSNGKFMPILMYSLLEQSMSIRNWLQYKR